MNITDNLKAVQAHVHELRSTIEAQRLMVNELRQAYIKQCKSTRPNL